jgi:two-component system chemotaxis sensor kinase CheA
MPKYFKKVRGLSGCTLLGNGDISLIIDVAGFFDK